MSLKGDNMVQVINPNNPNDIWVSGKRGRKPAWVIPILEEMGYKPEKKKILKVKQDDSNAWCLPGKCLIVAESEVEAIMLFNRTTKTPMSSTEIHSLWKKIKVDEHKGVFVFTNNEWVERKQIKEN